MVFKKKKKTEKKKKKIDTRDNNFGNYAIESSKNKGVDFFPRRRSACVRGKDERTGWETNYKERLYGERYYSYTCTSCKDTERGS